MIHEEICTCEVAMLAKEKGFPLRKVIKQDGRAFFYELPQSHPDWANCDAWYLPTQSLLQRWLRAKKALHIQITLCEKGWYYNILTFEYYEEEKEYSVKMFHQSSDFDTYELTLEDALKYALENLV